MKVAILFLGMFGLFAQLFNGYIIPPVLAASISLLLIFIFDFLDKEKFKFVKWLTLTLAITCIFCCIYDAYSYYSKPQISGNYYGGWSWSIPVTLCLIMYTRKVWQALTQNK